MPLTWLCDIANDSGIKLDFSTGSDEGIQRALVLTHKFNVSRKKNIKKNKEELSKKVGSYSCSQSATSSVSLECNPVSSLRATA